MSEQEKPKGVSRREFIKNAAAFGAGVAAVGTLAGCGAATSQNQKWDKEVDVVVVGTGTIAVAALVAADAGAKVLMLEKAPVFGGTSATSGGTLWIPNNYVMKAEGVADSREQALAFMKRVAEGQSNDELMNAFLDNAPKMVEWLRDKASFKWQRRSAPSTFADYYPFEGSLREGITRGVSIDRQDKVTGGKGLFMSVKEAIDARKIEVLYETPGRRLVTNEKGEVVGIIADSNGKDMAIKANRGVILGTGGFEHNKEMALHFLRGPLSWAITVPTCTGDGHLMAMAIGADLRNMNECAGLPGYKPDPNTFTGEADWQMFRGKPGAVVVNKYGERIGNESANYDTSLRAFHVYDTGTFEWRNVPSFAIFDSGYASRYAFPATDYKVGAMPKWMTKADTLDALAAALKIDMAGLKKNIEIFNDSAKKGVDPLWHRGESDFDKFTAGDVKRTELKNPCLAPLETPPFYGAPIWPGTCGTNGGLRVNATGQVINVWGKVIPGLYCSSNTMAHVTGAGYPGGGGQLGPGMTFAFIAGNAAAARKPAT